MSETGAQGSALAAVSAVVRATHDAYDSATLLGRVCESVTEHLGFDRAVVARYDAAGDTVELAADHGLPPLRGLTGLTTSMEEWPILRRARDTGAIMIAVDPPSDASARPIIAEADGIGTAVVVPLVDGDRCVGFLAADRRGVPFELDGSERALLATVGAIVAAFLQRALVHDDLLDTIRRKRDFIAFASHELRRPTAAVCGLATTLHVRWKSLTDEQLSSLLNVLYDQGQRLHSLIDQLLDLSRLQASSVRIVPAPLAVRERTEDIVRGVAAARADEIDIRIDPTLRTEADPEAFDRIVSNLIANALRHGQRPIMVSAAIRDRHFRLAVEDRGPGVTKEFAPRLFIEFSRGDSGASSGTGLGLSIAQAYAHAHGGQLVYEDAAPRGARFELVVPVARPHSRASGSSHRTDSPLVGQPD